MRGPVTPMQALRDEAGRLAPRPAQLLAERGIITLADENYFPGLEMLHRSVQALSPLDVACFDLGLTAAQRAAAAATPRLTILPLPDSPLIERIRSAFAHAPRLAKAHKRVWPLWICPALVAAAPFRRVFWLDCDIVVLRNLAGLFDLLDDGPVFTPENNAPAKTPNRPELYDLLPIDRPFDPLRPTVNAGVSGWDLARDRDVLAAYIHPVARACDDEQVRAAISWHDQGALIWAIQRCGVERCVTETTAWNLCVRHSAVAETPPAWDDGFIDRVRDLEPVANLLHWNGAKLPWLD